MTALPTNTGPGKLPGPLEKLLAGTGKAFNTADNFLQKPGGSLLMNLLAQQGYSTMPGSPLGAIGRAGLATQQQQRQSGADDLKRRLIEAQIGLYNAKASDPFGSGTPAKPPASIAEYNLYAEQTAAAGQEPVPFEAWVKNLAKLRATGSAEGKEAVSTPAQTAADTAFAQTFVEWTQNGQADALKGLNQLKAARATLDTDNVSGPGVGMIPNAALPYLNPKAANTKSLVEEVVQRNLRLILGAQFAEKEGERLIARAYDPALEEDINAERLDRLIAQMELAMESKQSQADYYNLNGTLKGWTGKTYSMQDFQDAVDSVSPDEDTKSPAQKRIEAL